MPEYRIEASRRVRGYEWATLYIHAKDEDEARNKAYEMGSDGDVEWDSYETDDYDGMEIDGTEVENDECGCDECSGDEERRCKRCHDRFENHDTLYAESKEYPGYCNYCVENYPDEVKGQAAGQVRCPKCGGKNLEGACFNEAGKEVWWFCRDCTVWFDPKTKKYYATQTAAKAVYKDTKKADSAEEVEMKKALESCGLPDTPEYRAMLKSLKN